MTRWALYVWIGVLSLGLIYDRFTLPLPHSQFDFVAWLALVIVATQLHLLNRRVEAIEKGQPKSPPE